jgi:hypothetical protein
MAAYLLTWNPERWKWKDIQKDKEKITRNGYCDERWSTGITRKIHAGDRIYLMRLGGNPRGITASGWATGEVFQGVHWGDRKKIALYINVRFDTILDPEQDSIFPVQNLDNDIYRKVTWTPQASGITIPDAVVEQLEKDWGNFLASRLFNPQTGINVRPGPIKSSVGEAAPKKGSPIGSDRDDGWQTINIDRDVFAFLQKEGRQLADNPNDVLRRLLLNKVQVKRSSTRVSQYFLDGDLPEIDPVEEQDPTGPDKPLPEISTGDFVRRILSQRFISGFSRVGRYVYMFESGTQLVYFQNYNKNSKVLWYRIGREDRQILNKSTKEAWLCLTCPSRNQAYIFPFTRIEERAKQSGWKPEKLEIHIYTETCKWAEFDWDIKEFRFEPK